MSLNTTHVDFPLREFSTITDDNAESYQKDGYVILNLRPAGQIVVKSFLPNRYDLPILYQQCNNMNIWSSQRPPGYQYSYAVQPVSFLPQELLDSLNEGG